MQEGLSLARSRAAYRIFLDQLTSLCAYAAIPSGFLSDAVPVCRSCNRFTHRRICGGLCSWHRQPPELSLKTEQKYLIIQVTDQATLTGDVDGQVKWPLVYFMK
jgi:hypothetical protein